MRSGWLRESRGGFALASTLLIILVLAVLAVGAAWLASSERRTSQAESVHLRALFAADAGTESAINFLRLSDDPPVIFDIASGAVRTEANTTVQGTQAFDYTCSFERKRPKAGWGMEYLDYDYTVTATGAAGRAGQSGVRIVASRLFRDGY